PSTTGSSPRCSPASMAGLLAEAGRRAAAAAGLLLALGCAEPQRTRVHVAVAANFAGTLDELARRFAAESGVELVPIVGSTGKLAAQVQRGAPFDLLLAADQQRPRLLEERGFAEPGTRFTYA